jgi:hypothetical protein
MTQRQAEATASTATTRSKGGNHVHPQPHPDRQPRPPRHRRRWPLLTSLALLLLAALTAAAAALHSIGGRDDTTSFTAAGAHELVVTVHAGRIELVPSPDSRIQVTTTRRWSLWAPTARHTENGGVLTLTGDCPLPGSQGITRCAVDQRVTVPAGTSVRVTANTGELTATDLAVVSFEAQASRGSISASFVRPPHRTLVRLDAGSVRLTVPATTYAVDATVPAHTGHLTIEVPTDPAAPRHISAHISRGDLQILRR